MLSPDELERASRFVFDRDRFKYVIGRTMLRTILANYLQSPGSSLEFLYNEQGKPAVVLEGSSESIPFNVSHAEDLLCIAVIDQHTSCEPEAVSLKLGVDVEFTGRDIPFREVALSHFSGREVDALGEYADPRHPFYRCWTRKEAYIKAHGAGVSYGLDQFGVSLKDEELGRPVFDHDPQVDPESWMVYSWTPAKDYQGSLVVNRPEVQIEHFTIDRASVAA